MEVFEAVFRRFVSAVLFAVVLSVSAGAAELPILVSGDWSVAVGPGELALPSGASVSIKEAVTLQVAPQMRNAIRDEVYTGLPVFNPTAAEWCRGARLNRLALIECSATGLLMPESVRLKPGPGDAPAFTRGVDYEFDNKWASFGRLEGGAIGLRQTVYVEYDYTCDRIDSIVVGKDGSVALLPGVSGVQMVRAPELPEGAVLLANVWVSGTITKLSDDNLLIVEPTADPFTPKSPSDAERYLPKTLAKLRNGEEVRIVAFGDSVTNGGGVDGHVENWYQHLFAAELHARFPKAAIRMFTAAWPGGNSTGYLNAPAGGPYDFERDVIAPKPDLVTIEFVNDAGLDEAKTIAHYGDIVDRLNAAGAEVILITPHLVRPDWLGVESVKVTEDPRAYVRGLRRFAAERGVALADASAGWCRLSRQGIPYPTLLANAINHPNLQGMQIFAAALMSVFPEK